MLKIFFILLQELSTIPAIKCQQINYSIWIQVYQKQTDKSCSNAEATDCDIVKTERNPE